MRMISPEPHDMVAEVHGELDQVLRVSLASLLQVSEVVARRRANRAGARRDQDVAIAQGAAADLGSRYGGLRAGAAAPLAAPGPVPSTALGAVDECPVAGSSSSVPAAALAPEAERDGALSAGVVAAPDSLAGLLGTSHPLTVDQDIAAALDRSPTGDEVADGAARRLAVKDLEATSGLGLD